MTDTTFATEFPDFPATDWPGLPNDSFCDCSWHNNAMPSMVSDKHGVTIWVNYSDKSKREIGEDMPRFEVERQTDGIELGQLVIRTDDWNEVLAAVAKEGNVLSWAIRCSDLDEACRIVQDALKIKDGGVASMAFSGLGDKKWADCTPDQRKTLLGKWLQLEAAYAS